MIHPRFLYSTLLRNITPTFSGTTLSGMPPISATDLMDWSYFRANTGNLDFVMTADTDIDAVAIYCRTAAGSNSIVLQYESAPSTFTTLATFSSPSASMALTAFTGVTVLTGRKIRFAITAATTIDIRQLMVGEAVTAERGDWAGVSPPKFLSGVKVTNNIGANGSILGRSIKRVERTGKIKLEYLTDSWVRATWEPFARYFAKYPFFYQWDPTGHASDIALCYAEAVKPPAHGSAGFLMAEVSIRMLVADSEAL